MSNIKRIRNKHSYLRAVRAAHEPAPPRPLAGPIKIENGIPAARAHKIGEESTAKICQAIMSLKVGQSFVCSRPTSARQAVMYARWFFPDRKYICIGVNETILGRVRVGRCT